MNGENVFVNGLPVKVFLTLEYFSVSLLLGKIKEIFFVLKSQHFQWKSCILRIVQSTLFFPSRQRQLL